jgi:hypothetical protein
MNTDPNPQALPDASMTAPCGINCWTCLAYLRPRNRCSGCRYGGRSKPDHRNNCRILNCEHLAKTGSGFCYDCEQFPCRRLKDLDKRYRTKYHTSLLENLVNIKTTGFEVFIKREYARWHCPDCGGTICIHRGFCMACNTRTS